MKRTHTLFCAVTALALATPLPALAQEDGGAQEAVTYDDPEAGAQADGGADDMDAMLAGLASMFPTEPLTQEQQSRLPQASRVVAMMIPEGSMAEMMGSMFDEMLGPIMAMAGAPSNAAIAKSIGVEPLELTRLSEEESAKLAALVDPAWEERQAKEMDILPTMMAAMMSAMEPSMRRAMSELYAINFSETELTEIEAFFETETGANFARKSFTMSSDPRVISASMEALPAMMESIASMEAKVAEATADLPEPRKFSELSQAEQEQIIVVTGFSREEIEANLEASQSIGF